MTSKIVLITGASSGIGLATAELLHEAGFIVYGTSRRTNNASKYKFHLIELDVNHDDSVNHAIEKVLENAKISFFSFSELFYTMFNTYQ